MAIKLMVLGSKLPSFRHSERVTYGPRDDQYEVPFPIKLNAYKLFGFSSHDELFKWAEASAHKKPGKVSLKSLIASQAVVDESNFKGMVEELQAGRKLEPILVMRVGNKYVIVDGHHRACAIYSVGQTVINVLIANPK
jgi:hypothetical protein